MYICINQRVKNRAPQAGIGTTWTLGDAEAWIECGATFMGFNFNH